MMTIEIGSLVVRGTFGSDRKSGLDEAALAARLAALKEEVRAELREEMADLIVEAERRAREA